MKPNVTFETGETVWVTTKEGVTLPTPCVYGPMMLEQFKGCAFSKKRPAMNWASLVPEWMLQGYGPVEAINLRNQLIKMEVPCNATTTAAIHATIVARWYQHQCPPV